MGAAAILAVLRTLVVVLALGVAGLGVWAKFTIADIETRGDAVLNAANLDPTDDAAWRSFFNTARNSVVRVFIIIGTSAFAALTTLLLIFSLNIKKMRLSAAFLLPLELVATIAMATAFGTTLSLTLKLPETLNNPSSSSDLFSFTMLLKLSMAWTIASGTAVFLLLTTTISFLVHTLHRIRDTMEESFEPTASALGMNDYQVPTMIHDNRSVSTMQDEEAGFFAEKHVEAPAMKVSVRVNGQQEAEAEWPLRNAGVRTERGHIVRPHRPWSEMPRP